MKLMLDTNTCIFIIKRRPDPVLKRFREFRLGDIGISAITYSELRYGVAKSLQREKNSVALSIFVGSLQIAHFGEDAAQVYGEVRATLERAGTPIGSLDMLIAAHAISHGATLVTNNTREFSRVAGLSLVDWTID